MFTQVISADEDVHCYKKGSTGKRRTAYPSELLDSTKYPHHSINLLLQPSGPVLHTARDRENKRRKGRERKRESQSPDTQQISKVIKGRGRKSVPSAKVTALLLQHRAQAEYQEHAASESYGWGRL